MKDPGGLPLYKDECIERRYNPVNNSVMDHVPIDLFDCKTSMMTSLGWFEPCDINIPPLEGEKMSTISDLINLRLINFPPRLELYNSDQPVSMDKHKV